VKNSITVFVEERGVELESALDWAWLAGIFEGEGTACMSPCYSGNGKRCLDRLVMSIAQKDPQMLVEIKRITKTGSIHYGKSWDGHHWVCASKAARRILTCLYPYLRTDKKKEQVSSAMAQDKMNRAVSSSRKRERGNATRNSLGRFSNAKIPGTEVESGVRVQ